MENPQETPPTSTAIYALALVAPAAVQLAADFDRAAAQIQAALDLTREEAVDRLRKHVDPLPVVDYRRAVHDVIERRW